MIALVAAFLFSFVGPVTVQAATAPDLGAAESYAVFGKAGVTNDSAVGTTHIWGNVGADATNVTFLDDATQVDGVIDSGVGVEAAILSAYGELAGEGVTGALDLAGNNTVTPGVYTVGATNLDGTLTLNGEGVYIFRSSSSISTSGPAQVVLTNGASACDVYWQIPTAMTIGTGTVMVGTIITNTAEITLATGASLNGRALSRNTQVTLDSNSITEPVCTAAVSGGGSNQYTATINVVKTVINDNGGTKTVADFPLFINQAPVDSGVTNNFYFFFPGSYTMSETSDPGYTQSFSGDCGSDGQLYLYSNENKFCIITNNDIGAPVVAPPVPPLIDVVKVPSPLVLPDGPDTVNYTYTLRNVGTVPVTDITMVGDTCYPIALTSGDTNADGKLDLTETWVYNCAKIISETHTNTVVATGWANGLSATDIASATVVVNDEIVPPLIHVTKVPSPLTLLAGGGTVTYTERITNPGTVALSNVHLTDDKCSPMAYVSGDVNGDSLLQTTETWTYTCQTNLTQSTTNTASATGEANGVTVRDLALATVTVAAAVPALPNTGLTPEKEVSSWNIGLLAGLITLASVLLIAGLKKRFN